MLARVLLDPGDVVVVEAPTYPGALHTFRDAGARFAIVPCDEHGMRVDLLPEVIERCRRETGRAPKLIYTIVNFSNPSGACLSAERRSACSQRSVRARDPGARGRPVRRAALPRRARSQSLFSLADGEACSTPSSFSKILAPGCAWRGRSATPS